MLPYESFSQVYDQMGHDRFSVSMAEYTLKLLGRFGYQPADGLDLCCGTGSAVGVFCDHGLSMSGLDRSKPMLRAARRKLRHRRVQLYHQELPRFDIRLPTASKRSRRQRFDLVTCFFDSLNYLKGERQLGAAFRSVYRHLKPGGWFVFDLNTVHMFKTLWVNGQPCSGIQDDIAWVFRSTFHRDSDSVDLLLTFFVKKGRRWDRFDEVHRQRAYPNTLIRALLRDAGLQVKGFYRCFTFQKPGRTARKICVAARRPD